jgi:hypothetical protein
MNRTNGPQVGDTVYVLAARANNWHGSRAIPMVCRVTAPLDDGWLEVVDVSAEPEGLPYRVAARQITGYTSRPGERRSK